MKIVAGSILFITSTAFAVDPCWGSARWSNFLYALRQTETGGQVNGGIGAIGDGGKAFGPLQIRIECLTDAQKQDNNLKNITLNDCCNNLIISEKVCKQYIMKYLPKNGNEFDAARIWNGGPRGHKKKSTLKYLSRFLIFFR